MKKNILSLLVFLMPFPVLALPKNVIIVRHGEKIPGKMYLSPKGYERAAALPDYFLNTPSYNTPPIGHILATGLGDLGGPKESIRPIETCTPTATRYKLPLNINFKKGDPVAVAQELLTNKKYENQTVLLCWEHREIPKIVTALGGTGISNWPDNIFDQTYLITFKEREKNPEVKLSLQKLMYGDRTNFTDAQPPLLPMHLEKGRAKL